MATTKRAAKSSQASGGTRAVARGPVSAGTQIRGFVAKYTPDIAARMRDARKRMRALFPRGCELVYDNHNALAIGYASSERAADAILSIAAYPKWVTLFFLHGANLDDDPHGLLQGAGSRVRSIRLVPLTLFDDARVRALIKRALAPHAAALRRAAPLRTIVKSVSARQRPRRPAPAAKRPTRG